LKRELKTFQDKNKLKQIISTNPTLHKILKGIFHTEEDEK
jgi:hypothetical protein